MPLLEVQRASGGYTEHLNPFEVVMDGELVGLLGPSESAAFELTAGSHEMFVRFYWCQSEEVDIQLEEDEKRTFRCETRANLLTDGYWATFGRRRYLRLTQVSSARVQPVSHVARPENAETVSFRPRRPAVPLFLMVAVGFLSLALSQGLGFLTSIAAIFMAVQVIVAINFHLLSPRFGPVEGIKSHEPFRFRIVEEAVLSGGFAVAGIASLAGVLHEGSLAGWLALGAAAVGALNVIATHRSAERVVAEGRLADPSSGAHRDEG
jgi:hypothetical protein